MLAHNLLVGTCVEWWVGGLYAPHCELACALTLACAERHSHVQPLLLVGVQLWRPYAGGHDTARGRGRGR
eukprot:158047-Pyramimonas_sp.AAC.5